MPAHSSDIVWSVLRKHSSFVRKQRGVRKAFTREPLNLKSVHSPRYCGLANKKAVDIQPAADGKGIVFAFKKQTNQRKPRLASQKVTLKRDGRRSYKIIGKFMKGSKYQPQFRKLAMRRASRILSSQKPVTPRKVRQPRKQKTTQA